MSFPSELQAVINRHSKENESDTPDFVLAQFLEACLAAYAQAVQGRDRWNGDGTLADQVIPQ